MGEACEHLDTSLDVHYVTGMHYHSVDAQTMSLADGESDGDYEPNGWLSVYCAVCGDEWTVADAFGPGGTTSLPAWARERYAAVIKDLTGEDA
jgi:hypothetical protein